jgi:cystathionine beta-synthase
MRPLDQLHAVTPDTTVSEAMEIMSRDDVNQLPVMRDGQIEGFISRGGILRLLQTQAELEV